MKTLNKIAMKIKSLSFALVVMSVVAFTQVSCAWRPIKKGNGDVIKELRDVENFSKVSASAGVNVFLTKGNSEKVVVETDANLQECIITEVRNGKLVVKSECNVRRAEKFDVHVTYTDLNGIDASSGADVVSNETIKTDDLKLHASSAGDIKLEVNTKSLSCHASSGGDISVEGKTQNLNADASSGGDIKGFNLTASKADASASSGGDVKITVSDELNANASSGGDVKYKGSPKKININESSGGDVSKR